MVQINANRRGIVLIVDGDRRLVDTITDGDIRRAILSQINLETPAAELVAHKKHKGKTPQTMLEGTDEQEIMQVLEAQSLRQMPILNENGQIVDLVFYTDLLKENVNPTTRAVVMAGGFGKRLHPLTDNMPKPMLPVGDQPLISHILSNIKQANIKNVTITTHYLPEKIQEFLGDGTEIGIDINYIHEDTPCGTAGGLQQLKQDTEEENLLVVNGDILTSIDFDALLSFHKENDADLTLAVRPYEFLIPYGVVEIKDNHVQSLVEKPKKTYFVNAGIYVLKREVLKYIPSGSKKTDMTDLIDVLLQQKKNVVSFPLHEYWRDIGQHEDYANAQKDIQTGILN